MDARNAVYPSEARGLKADESVPMSCFDIVVRPTGTDAAGKNIAKVGFHGDDILVIRIMDTRPEIALQRAIAYAGASRFGPLEVVAYVLSPRDN